MQYYKITKNGHDKATSLTHEEAINKIASLANDAAMEKGLTTDEDMTIIDNGRVIFSLGDESVSVGDDNFELKIEKD